MTTKTKTKTDTISLPTSGRGVWRDVATPGLELLGNRGGASWYLRHRLNGKRVRDLVGRWPALDIDGAREAVRVRTQAAAVAAAAGADVLAVRAERQEAKRTRRASITLGEALDLYRADRLAHLKSGGHAEKVIRLVFGPLLPKLLVDLTKADLTGAIETKRRTAPATADTATRYAKPLFGWIAASGRGDNLLADLKARQTRKRDRTLTLAELGQVLRALDSEGDAVGALCARTLIATAGRLEEVAGMRRAELDLDARLWRLPAARNKSGRDHIVPLSDEALAAIQAALALGQGELVFAGRTGSTSFSGWSRFKDRIDRVSSVTDWVFHDARRTFATVMADRGIDAHVADRCLNHSGAGTLSGVARIYQRSELLDQRRQALDLWSDAMGEARALAGSADVVVLAERRA